MVKHDADNGQHKIKFGQIIVYTLEQQEPNITRVLHYCKQIRSAILFIKDKSTLFRDFPKGCCRDVSVIAGLYLEEKGCSGIAYCSKEFTQPLSSHAWLEYNGLIIDLTADQFNNEFPKVLIIPVSEAGSYHQKNTAEIYSMSIAGMDCVRLLSDYALIKNEIKKYQHL